MSEQTAKQKHIKSMNHLVLRLLQLVLLDNIVPKYLFIEQII